jgi:hypothetical protein
MTPDDAVEAELLETSNLQSTIQRGVHPDSGDRARNIDGGDRLERYGRNVHLDADCRGVRNAIDKLEELH